jgi:hypothetical protein
MTTSTAYQVPAPYVFLNPFSLESIGQANRDTLGNLSAVASATYIAAQRALYFPFSIPRTITVYRYFWANGTTASTNNFQVGVYDRNGNAINRGTSTLATGASQLQFDNVTDFSLPEGSYYMAIWGSGTTAHLTRGATAVRYTRLMGCFQESSLASGLQATATFATMASAYVPLFGLACRSTP